MYPTKINLTLLYQMLRQGKSQAEIAKYFGVAKSSVSLAKKRLKERTGAEVDFPKPVVSPGSVEAIKPIVTEHLNLIAQLRHINDSANGILEYLNQLKRGEGISEAEHRKLTTAIKAGGEIRIQLGLQMEIFEKLHGAQAAMRFNQIVLTIIEEQVPEVRNQIINALMRERSVGRLMPKRDGGNNVR